MKFSLGNPPPLSSFKPSKKTLRVLAIVAGTLLTLLVIAGIVVFVKRDALLKAAVARAKIKARTDYALDLAITNARFAGIKTVKIDEISVIPEHRDSLLHLRGLSVSVRFFPLLFGHIKLSEVLLASGKLNLVKKDSIANYDFLFRKKKRTQNSGKRSLAQLADNLLNNFLNKVPDELDAGKLEVRYTADSTRLSLFVPVMKIHDGDMSSTILLNRNQATWHVGGTIDPDDKQFDLGLYADGRKVEIPLIDKYHMKVNFDEARMKLTDADRDGDELRLATVCSVKNLLVNQPRIALNDIVVPDGSIEANVVIGENFLELDSSSVVHLKNVSANPYIKYTLSPVKIYELGLHTEPLDAQALFNSFPKGMFESLEGMRVQGKLQYDLRCSLDSSLPDSVQFRSSLTKSPDFKILGWGKANLQKINGSFVYTPYEFGKPVRPITIGPENPEFVPIENISPNLRNAVLTAEDPTFYSHRGFVELAIRRSIATDFKTKAFKQGGSTISMQLVKNVYLNRQKTMARKIEEMLIVWLIENNHLSTKQRMFESYLNLIEWGPNIYGISEAARYYFGKYPSELDLGESIFLASIVPRPKKAMYFFEPDGSLRQSLHGYFHLIGGLMARHGYTQRDTSGDYGFYNVRLREGLRMFIAPDSTVSDSTLLAPDDETSEDFLDRVLNRKSPDKKPDTISIHDLDKLVPVSRDTTPARPLTRKEKRTARKREKEEKKRLESGKP